MTCSQCGVTAAAADQVFCHSCGAPMAPDLDPAPAAFIQPSLGDARRIRQDFTGGALALFGWLLLLTLSLMLIVPAPFAMVAYFRWFLGKCSLDDGSSYRFLGSAGSVWVLTTIYGLVGLVSLAASIQAKQEPAYGWVQIAIIPVNLVLSWFFLRWGVGWTEVLGRRLSFKGSVWGLIGWTLLIYVSVLTIIGWAWGLAGYSDWMAKNVRAPGLQYEFVGKGHEILWRTLVCMLCIFPIVTIPWAFKWYTRWFIQQFEAVETQRAPAEQVGAVSSNPQPDGWGSV